MAMSLGPKSTRGLSRHSFPTCWHNSTFLSVTRNLNERSCDKLNRGERLRPSRLDINIEAFAEEGGLVGDKAADGRGEVQHPVAVGGGAAPENGEGALGIGHLQAIDGALNGP